MKQTSLTMTTRVAIAALTGLLLATGCSTIDKATSGRKVDYKKSQTTEPLEVPPDLTSSAINEAPDLLKATSSKSYSESSSTAPAAVTPTVLPQNPGMHVERDGNQEWLLIDADPAQVWPKVRDFWLQQGFLIKKEDPRLGILETGWAENRADIPSGIIRDTLGKIMDFAYSAATRDQYRVRLEHGTTPGTTELYLTQRGMEEVVTGTTGEGSTMWKPRPSDPELEVEMLKRLMVFLGVEEQKAKTMLATQPQAQTRAELISNSSGVMLIDKEDFSRAWRRTGVALDRIGFAVEDRNRAKGVYFVRYDDPLADDDKSGWFSKLAFWSSGKKEAKQYQIALLAQGAQTQIIVNGNDGKRENSSTAKRILTLLEEQLR
jgi:outer membrane protein assembly factor BamC